MRTWLITGVSSGFGYEMTKQLLENGEAVIGTVRNTKNVQDFIVKYPGKFDCQILDVTDIPAVHKLVKDSFSAISPIMVLSTTLSSTIASKPKSHIFKEDLIFSFPSLLFISLNFPLKSFLYR